MKNALIRDPRDYEWTADLYQGMPKLLALFLWALVVGASGIVGMLVALPFSYGLYGGMYGLWTTIPMAGVPLILGLFLMWAQLNSSYKSKHKLSETTINMLGRYNDLPRSDRALFGDDYASSLKILNPKTSDTYGSTSEVKFVRTSNELHNKIQKRNQFLDERNRQSIDIESRVERMEISSRDIDSDIEIYQQYS